MSTYRHWTGPRDVGTDLKVHVGSTSCYSSFFNFMDTKHVDLLWDATVEKATKSEEDLAIVKFDRSTVHRHVKLLRQCGFVFEFEELSLPKSTFSHYQAGGYPVVRKAEKGNVDSYRFSFYVEDNAPVLAKFAINAVRWIHQNVGCFMAFHKMVEESGAENELDTFNLLSIASATHFRSSNHNVGHLRPFGYIKPFTAEEFAKLHVDKNPRTSMSMSLKYEADALGLIKLQYGPTFGRYSTAQDIVYLAEPGGYARYMAELEQTVNRGINSELAALKGALGI